MEGKKSELAFCYHFRALKCYYCFQSPTLNCSIHLKWQIMITVISASIIQSFLAQIYASTSAGALYAVQTLLSLTSPRTSPSRVPLGIPDASSPVSHQLIPSCLVHDAPRYPYRGMHVDISRNFQEKSEILQLLELMAAYKMNKFHFHLTDDEGWRLEIPGLEELTQVVKAFIRR